MDKLFNVKKKSKPTISINHTINWYMGNYIMNPNNALRDNETLLDQVRQEMENLRVKRKDQTMTHKQFLELVKKEGIHNRHYLYKKQENNCELCKRLGIKQRY